MSNEWEKLNHNPAKGEALLYDPPAPHDNQRRVFVVTGTVEGQDAVKTVIDEKGVNSHIIAYFKDGFNLFLKQRKGSGNELNSLNVPVRFFVDNPDNQEDGEDTLREVCEAEFLEAEGVILYKRHTVFENGCSQICLTKDAWGRG